MSSKLTEKYGLRFCKGERLKVLFQLLWNALLYVKWQIYKVLHGIHHPVVHYYAVCWNEEKMLPFMFHHYEAFVDKFFIYDNESTDSSLQIISNHPNATIIPYISNTIDDEKLRATKNECWKSSRGKADYVIVCDMDEFVYVPDFTSFIGKVREYNVSIPQSVGFNMCSKTFPDYLQTPSLPSAKNKGVQDDNYSKCVVFNPYKIVEINYEPGAHFCHPIGLVKYSSVPMYKLLHYKNIGIDYVLNRVGQYKARLSKANMQKGYGEHYLYDIETIKSQFYYMLGNSDIVV